MTPHTASLLRSLGCGHTLQRVHDGEWYDQEFMEVVRTLNVVGCLGDNFRVKPVNILTVRTFETPPMNDMERCEASILITAKSETDGREIVSRFSMKHWPDAFEAHKSITEAITKAIAAAS